MTAPLVRILLRYGAGYLIARGLLDNETGNMLAADPELAAMLELAAGTAMAALSEAWFYLAKRYGWAS